MRYKLEILNGSRTTWPIESAIHIGTDANCPIRIQEPDVDERHCRIELRGENLFIKDLRSVNGTFVNGARILEAQLSDGDILTTGHAEFVVHDENKRQSEFPLRSACPSWARKLGLAAAVAQSNHSVLLLGPSGTGKDVLARNIHDYSERKNQPFLSVNCSALTESLVESELFGHVKGSFTGALGDRKGAFESARNGTLFLDEIGDLSYPLQAKLLRALENEEIRPVGSDRTIQTDVRIIAATHQNLYEKIHEGSFRADLFYRLNIISIEVPRLADRLPDFEEIFYFFARKFRVRFSHNAIQKLKRHDWPGNIRELKNTVARASTLYPKQYVTDDLVDELLNKKESAPEYVANGDTKQLSVIKEIEKQMILKRLTANGGNQKKTALELGLPKSTLHDRIKNYSIELSALKH